MSLLGEDVAVLCVGMSCQPAHVLRTNIDLFRELTGDQTLQVSGMPFDWILADPIAVASWLRDMDAFPLQHEIHFRGPAPGKPWWPEKNLFFWHAFEREGRRFDDVPGMYHRVLSKHRYMVQKVRELSSRRRCICIVSNTQGDLPSLFRTTDSASAYVTAGQLLALREAVDEVIGHDAELMFVTLPHLYGGGDIPRVTVLPRLADSVTDEWTGNQEHWVAVIRAYFEQTAATYAEVEQRLLPMSD